MFGVGIPHTFPEGYEDNDVPTFWLLLYACASVFCVRSSV